MYLDKLIKYFMIRSDSIRVYFYKYNAVYYHSKILRIAGNIFKNLEIIFVLIWVEIQPSPQRLYEILDVELIYGCIRWRFADVFPRLQLSNKFLFFQLQRFVAILLMVLLFLCQGVHVAKGSHPSIYTFFYKKYYYKKM